MRFRVEKSDLRQADGVQRAGPTVMCRDERRAGRQMRLIEWDTRSFVSRMRFVLSVAQISVNEAGVQKIGSAVKNRSLAIIQSSSFKTFVDNHAWAADDLTWYTKNSSKGYFGKSWKNRISNDAQKNSNGTAAAWQMDVKEIKNGQTLTVGHIINSLEPSGDSWGLTLRTPAKPEPVPPGPNSNPAPGPSKNGSSDLVSVNLMGFNAHYHSAKKLYKNAFGKKTDPIKDEAKAVKEDAEIDIDTAIDNVEKDVAHDVERTVEDIVETDIVDAETLVADSEIDILA
jgi:hypothetical protein